MQLKVFLLSAMAICFFGAVKAQDKIYKKNGEVIDSKIKSVGVKTVTYMRFDNQTGPEYTIIKNEVEKIVYQNGTEDDFGSGKASRQADNAGDENDNNDPKSKSKIHYKPNLLTISPIQFTENGLGFGLSYETAIDKKGIISFYVPAALTFNLNNGTYYDATTGNQENGHVDAMAYIMPGIKVYPTGAFGFVRYAIGPSLVIGDGQKSNYNYNPYSGYPSSYQTQSHFLLGMIVNNSLNINPSPHIYMGIELGLGFTYLDRVGGLNQTTSALVQGGLKIGYRF